MQHGHNYLVRSIPSDMWTRVAETLRSKSPQGDLYLMATWSRAEVETRQVAFGERATNGAAAHNAPPPPADGNPQRALADTPLN